jgi:very-short-patch-repair endonuclease
VVELDDSTHNQLKRKERDKFVDKVLQAAGIPVYHFAARRAYSVLEVRAGLFGEK